MGKRVLALCARNQADYTTISFPAYECRKEKIKILRPMIRGLAKERRRCTACPLDGRCCRRAKSGKD